MPLKLLYLFNKHPQWLTLKTQDFVKQGFSCARERDLVEVAQEDSLRNEITTQHVALYPGQSIPGTGWAIKNQISSSGKRLHSLDLSYQDIRRWQMAWEFGHTTGWSFGHFRFDRPVTAKGFVEAYSTDNDVDKVGLGIGICVEEEFDVGMATHFSRVGLGLTLVNLLYGGLHALAWSAHFRTPVEATLWRISAITVMFGLLSVQVTHAIPSAIKSPRVTMIWVWYGLLVFVAYFYTRLYLIVESFINLANLPSGVYKVPQWPAYFPHLSS